jgi:hypothetical protein
MGTGTTDDITAAVEVEEPPIRIGVVRHDPLGRDTTGINKGDDGSLRRRRLWEGSAKRF